MRRWKFLMARCAVSIVAACSLGLGATALAVAPAAASTPHPHGTYTAYLSGPSFTLVLGWRHAGEIGGTPLSWSTSHGTISTLEYITEINPYTGQPFSIPVTMTGHLTNAGISSASDPGTVEVNGSFFATWYAVRVSGG